MICDRTAVTCWNASCFVSSSFFAAERYWPSAPKLSAACAFCSADRLLRTPNQVNSTLTAAKFCRSRRAAATADADADADDDALGDAEGGGAVPRLLRVAGM